MISLITKLILQSFGAAIRDKANALRNEDVERIFGCFQDPNAEYAALLETIQKDLKQHRH